MGRCHAFMLSELRTFRMAYLLCMNKKKLEGVTNGKMDVFSAKFTKKLAKFSLRNKNTLIMDMFWDLNLKILTNY